jgi:uncharacterized damage-inducible protein DinB
MGERAQALAEQFEQANQAVIDAVEAAPDDAWSRTCQGEQCTVAALAYHIGSAHGPLVEYMARPLAEGAPLPSISRDQVNAINAENATNRAAATKEEALAVLRENGANVIAFLRGLSDDDLDRSAVLPMSGHEMTAGAFIERIIIGHPRQHLESMRQAMG